MWSIPKGERQSFGYDTNACGIFAVLNAIESWLIKYNLPELKYLDNISDRYTAINVGGLNGNLPTDVIDSINKYGLLSEQILPFDGVSKSDYYNKNIITPDMVNNAKKVLDILEISYEYVNFGLGKEYSVKEELKVAPLVGVYNNDNGTSHAIMIPNETQYLDSYEPFIKSLNINKLHYAIKVIVKVKPMTKYKYFNEVNDPKMMMVNPKLMQILDTIRGECGFPITITSGFRTKEENAKLKGSVEDSAHLLGMAVDVNIDNGAKRIKFVTSAIKNGIKRIGLAPTFLHLDIDSSKPDSIWFY